MRFYEVRSRSKDTDFSAVVKAPSLQAALQIFKHHFPAQTVIGITRSDTNPIALQLSMLTAQPAIARKH
jgi:hypothetical protein